MRGNGNGNFCPPETGIECLQQDFRSPSGSVAFVRPRRYGHVPRERRALIFFDVPETGRGRPGGNRSSTTFSSRCRAACAQRAFCQRFRTMRSSRQDFRTPQRLPCATAQTVRYASKRKLRKQFDKLFF